MTAQLIDTLTGNHIWAEKYDRVLEDIFAVQEEVTECIVGAIAPQVDAAESLRARRRPSRMRNGYTRYGAPRLIGMRPGARPWTH